MTGTIQAHTFQPRDLVGGHVVVDLLNTVTARDAEPVDWLDGYPRLLEWAALTGEFAPDVLTELRTRADAEPGAAARALERIRELREAVRDVLVGVVHGDGDEAGAVAPAPRELPPGAESVVRVENHWKQAAARSRLTLDGGTPHLRLDVATSGLDYLTHDLALRALDLLRALPRERTRVCPGLRCGWVFVDTSRAGRRRWCDMATCGNAAKGRSHYRRKRDGADTETGKPPVAEPPR
ncbi:CGNR zinc finger domain-containing protein [Uniformispora flossi]|uniref:CGNR zinc finger domain-containing protein n=1 Tax=Uniformispora flossi TaxID=3390723 RepID=UPI003C2E5346